MEAEFNAQEMPANGQPAAAARQPFVAPKLTFVRPELVRQGSLADVTAGFFGTFLPDF